MKKYCCVRWMLISSVISVVILSINVSQAVDTQIQTDGSLAVGAPLNVNAPPSGAVYPINENNGQAAGSNLFFSFSNFNIGSGDTAYFNFTQNWNNVISRVTGGTVSIIDGILRVGGSRTVNALNSIGNNTPVDGVGGPTVLNNGAKNFFLINPAGITFGPGSVVDVPGSFYASTASSVKFNDGFVYKADGTQTASTLSAAQPESFGFLGNETGALTLNNAKLQVFSDETLALVGREVNILNNSTVGQVDMTRYADGYNAQGLLPFQPVGSQPRFELKNSKFIDGIQLLLLANRSQKDVPIFSPEHFQTAFSTKLDGDIRIKDTTLINAGGDAEEITFLRGGNISLSNANIVSSNYGDDCAGFCGGIDPIAGVSGIDILATGKLSLNNSHIITETSFSPVNPLDNVAININANSLLMDNGSSISTKSLNVPTTPNTSGPSFINPAFIPAGITPVPHPVNPKAGDININVAADFVAKGGSSIESSTYTFGDAGKINIVAGSIDLNNATIKSESMSDKNGLIGYVNNGFDSISCDVSYCKPEKILDNGNLINLHPNDDIIKYLYQTLDSQYTNPVEINSASIGHPGGFFPTFFVNLLTQSNNAGKAGEINLTATNGNISVTNGSAISTDIHSGTQNSGLAKINLVTQTGSISLDNSAISSTTSGDANAGDVTLSATQGALTLNNGAKITTDSLGINGNKSGNAGQITAITRDSIVLANSAITTNVNVGTQGATPAKIDLTTTNGSINLNNSVVSSKTSGDADAGDVTLSANNGALTLANGSRITTDSLGLNGNKLGNAGQIKATTRDTIQLDNSAITTDVNIGTQNSSAKIDLTTANGSINLNNSVVSSKTSGDANAGDVTLSANNGALTLTNGSKITTDSLGINGNQLGNAGQINAQTRGNISLNNSAITTDVAKGTQGAAAQIGLNTVSGSIDLNNSLISSTTSGDAHAGDVTLMASQGHIALSGGSRITTDALGLNNNRLGNAGKIAMLAGNNIDIAPLSFVSSSTNGLGGAGSVNIVADNLNIQGVGPIPLNQLGRYTDQNFTGIRSLAFANSGGQTGTIDIQARGDVNLTDGAQISISNLGNASNPKVLTPTHININATNVKLISSQVVADSNGNVDAGSITINFKDWLNLDDPSAISTTANQGNGGDINLNGGDTVWLQDSQITTSVLSPQGKNGGNIRLKSDYLIMDSGFIQANTAAKGASGGLVNIDVGTLVPSSSTLFVGGNTPFNFQPFSGINVIQAAAPDGVNGQINATNPQLNLSGTLANLIIQTFDPNAITRDLCAIAEGSFLTPSGKGALRRRAKDALITTGSE